MAEDPTGFLEQMKAREGGLALLDLLLAEAPFGVYVDDPAEGCVYANQSLLDQFGVGWEDFRGFGWARFVEPDDAERLREAIQRYEVDLQPIYVTYRVRGHDDTVRWVHARVRPVLDGEGRQIGSVGLTQDVTDEREIREEWAEAQKLEAVGRLAGRVAHDFNNLLTAVLVSTDLLTDHVEEEQQDELQAINGAVEQARQLTEQLLTLSRRRVRRRERSCCLDDEIASLETLLKRTLGEGIALEVSTDAPGCVVPLDSSQLSQVVLNLATNGRDAMEGYGPLGLRSWREGDDVHLSVSDRGSGMDAEMREKAFETFFTTKGAGRGTGLGLSTVRDIVTFAGGDVWIESEVGRGTTMRVQLPLVDERLEARNPPAADALLRQGTEKVLLVEDIDALRQAFAYALAIQGYRVSAAGSLDAARARLAESPVDAVVTDVMLPDGEGTSLVDALRRDQPGLPAVFLSGFAGEATGRLDLSDPATAFLSKPFRTRELVAALGRVIEAGRSTGEARAQG